MGSDMRMIVGVSGATGVEMSYYLVRALKDMGNCEIHLILSEGAKVTWDLESSVPLEELTELADFIYDEKDLAAAVSSGSFVTDGMVILPCSMKTLAGISVGYAENLLIRAADVCLKEGRKVVLVPREMPFGKIHIENLKKASDLGCVIVPPVLTFYNNPRTLEDQIHHIIGKSFCSLEFPMNILCPGRERPKNKGALLDKPGYLSVIISWDKIPFVPAV